ncbi:MAG TPA: hypothetical protein VH280_25715 [Verrucomicrobiae bacterium]|nr:hypothetical protein [Verrucomicrobiae bacterium]
MASHRTALRIRCAPPGKVFFDLAKRSIRLGTLDQDKVKLPFPIIVSSLANELDQRPRKTRIARDPVPKVVPAK